MDPNLDLPIIQPDARRGVEADGRDPDLCGLEGVVSRSREVQLAQPVLGGGDAPKVYFVTFGCQMNKYDTELMEGALEAAGYAFTADPDEADVILYNTCSVREKAENRVLGRVGALKKRRAMDPNLRIGIVGCMAQRDGEGLMKRLPHVDLVLGTQMLDELPGLLNRCRAAGEKIIAVEERHFASFSGVQARRKSPFQGWLTVTRGCNKRCTFCIVPTTRGPEVSRPVEDVEREARALVADGVVELTLLGQTIDTYGMDLDNGASLSALLRRLAPLKGEGLRRLRFVTSHPSHIDEELMETMAELSGLVCPFLHMPAQHGSDRVLRRMKRLYKVDHYVERCAKAREIVPDIAIASDFIVGFCGETEEDFRQAVDLVERMDFSMSFIFKYSVRPGTPASKLPDDVPDEVKKERHQILMDAQLAVSERLNQSYVGVVRDVLVEGPSRTNPDVLTGRDRTHRIVVFGGPEDLVGKEVPVRITGATALSLRGKRVGDT